MNQREWHARRPEGFFRKPSHHDGVLATGEKQGRILELGGGFAEHEDGFRFKLIEVAEVVGGHGTVKAEILKTEILRALGGAK
jgi:hypothetical protein